MKWSSIVGGVCLGVSWLLPGGSVAAAVLTGRVVDSAGQPIVGAEVRIWQKVPKAAGPGTVDQPVKFDTGEVLLTDAEGTFTSPDALLGEAFARIVAETKGTLAGRSAWLEIPPGATVVAPKVVLKRLRAVIGQVHDRKGRPIAGAVVFDSGDAHERLETKTGRNGKFFLEGVPEGSVFLFVEKAGYRFAGMRLPAVQSEAAFTLATFDEIAEPLTSLPPPLSADEETALARDVLKQWLQQLLPRGTDEQKFFLLAALAGLDPLEALDGLDKLGVQGPGFRGIASDGFLEIADARSGELTADKLRAAIESADHPLVPAASHFAKAARHLPNRERRRQLEWLEAAQAGARQVKEEVLRAEALALIADTLFLIGERDRAETTLAEAEALAATLPETSRSRRVYGLLALAAVHVDAERAVEWLDKMKADHDYPRFGTELAMRLLPERPEMAEEVWNRSQAGSYLPESLDLLPLTWRGVYLPDFCYRLALIDLARAERVAAAAERAALRFRGQGTIALALAKQQPVEARRMLESLVRAELPRMAVDDGLRFRRWTSRSATAAWLLPIAEHVAPDLCREILWRSLASRLPRPRHDHFDDTIELADLELAKMLARYDRDMARALVEPLAARAVQRTAAGGTELKSPQAIEAAALATRFGRELAIAAAHVDARWAKELVERMPYGRAGSRFHPIDFARQALVWTLARHGVDRWSDENEVCAGFWRPPVDDEFHR